MIDITRISNGEDLGLFDTDVERAKNVLSVQVGNLEYLPEFGIDLEYFLDERFEFENDSFKGYLIDRLAFYSINVTSLINTFESLFSNYKFSIQSPGRGDGLVSR